MQSVSAIQSAHDTLVRGLEYMLSIEAPSNQGALMMESLRVLCWVLEDEPAQHLGSYTHFADDLERLDVQLAREHR